MNLDDRLKINAPQVVHETIDGETILLNLDIGTYYSLNDMGAFLWALIEKNHTKREMIEKVNAHFDCAEGKIDGPIDHFLDEIIQEGLVVPVANGNQTGAPPAQIPAGLGDKTTGFSIPVLNKYTDMQDLLLLDPIHDVDDAGWPAIKAD